MARLWIANTTTQHHEFIYRPKISDGGVKDGILRPMFGEARQQRIPVGGQICVGGPDGLDDGMIRTILDQHKHIVDFTSLPRVQGFQGLCYKIGPEPVPIEKILERIDENAKAREAVANDRQVASTLEIAARMRSVAGQEGAPFTDLRETTVQIAQKGHPEVNNGTPKLNRVVEVPEDGKEPSRRGRMSAS